MRLVTYQREGQVRVGAQLAEQVVDLNRAYRGALQQAGNVDELAVADVRVPTDMLGLLSGGEASLKAAQQALAFAQGQLADKTVGQRGIVYAMESVSLLSPVLRPGKLVCLGLNYHRQAREVYFRSSSVFIHRRIRARQRRERPRSAISHRAMDYWQDARYLLPSGTSPRDT